MKITEDQMTGLQARQLRESLGLSQKEFWGAVGVLQSVGARYETGSAHIPRIPRAVRILLVANYIAGLRIDASTQAGVEELVQHAAIQGSVRSARASTASARSDLDRATKNIQAAKERLANV